MVATKSNVKTKKVSKSPSKSSIKNSKIVKSSTKSPTKSPNKSPTKSPPKKQLSKSNRYNKVVSNCLKNCIMPSNNNNSQKNNSMSKFKNEKSYQDSFTDLLVFSKKITETMKKSIGCIIFNVGNADGVFAASIAVKYLQEKGISSINFIPIKPYSGKGVNGRLKYKENLLKDKVVIVLDLSYNQETVKYLNGLAKELIIIDDHPRPNSLNSITSNVFIGNNEHGACAYTWKFFFPTKKVPMNIQFIDNKDRSLHLPYLKHGDSFISFLNFRVIHNPFNKFTSIEDFNKLDQLIEDINAAFMNVVGHYYDEVENNIKEQIARNAKKQFFQGYPVYVLNYKDPVLYKKVAKQMITNAKQRGDNIAFAVLWAYEYSNNCYNIHLSEGVGVPKYKLPDVARTLGRIGETGKGGGGAHNIGNFYWPRNNEKDIWDLFTKTPTFLQK